MHVLIDKPDWPKVSETEFKQYLKACPDYVRDGYIGSVRYRYRHNNQHFATVIEERDGKESIYLKP